ncbi:Conserved_hypothetical protein [Hexamita inflata]|uniref:Uncharacterized protein n=1 Tax=Hexamita inflata TaxID=28002 RepID=A0ABP1ISX3_9EUKA
MSDNENSTEYEYYSDDYYSETSDDTIQIQINEMKKQILNMQKVASPPKAEQLTYNKPSPIFQQQSHAQQNESISATAAAVSAAVQTALQNQQQLLMNRNFGYQRQDEQRQDEYITENQPPAFGNLDYDNKNLSGSQKLSSSQQLYQSPEIVEQQCITTQHIDTQASNQLNETQKIIMSNQQKLQLLAKQKQQVSDSIKPIDPIEIQQVQPESIQKTVNQENQEHIKKIQQLQAKIEEREDVIKSLVKIIKKRDPSFVLAQILGNKQLEKELDRNSIESQNLQTNEAAQNKSRNQANTTIYQEDNRLSESQIQEMRRKSGLQQTNQLPTGFKQVSKNANYEQDYQVINNESNNQNAKEYSNNIQKQKQSGISFQMTDEKQTKQQKQQTMSNNQNIQEQKYLDSNEIKQKQSSSIQFDSKPITQQQQLKQEPSVQSQPEPQGVLSFEDFLKQRAKYAAKLEIESSKQEQSSPQFDPKVAEFEQMKQQKQMLQQQNEQLQTQLQNRLQQVQQPQYSPPSSYQNLQPQNNYSQQNQPSYQQPNQYQVNQQNYQQQQQPQQQQNQPNQSNYQPQQQSQQQYQNSYQPAFAQNNQPQPNQPQNTFQQQNTVQQPQNKPYQSQAFDPNFNSYEQIKQNSSAAEHQVNKNSNNSDAIKAKMTFDLNNPRYKMFKDVDSKYNVIQQQAEEHKNEMNALLSKKVGRKEQIRINFLEERLKDLFGESARLKVQLKVFEKEFI